MSNDEKKWNEEIDHIIMKYLFTEKCINFRLSLSLLLLVREKKKNLSWMQMTKHGNNATNVVNIHKHKRGSFVECSIFVIKPYLLTVGLIAVRIAWFSYYKHLTFNFPEHLRLAFSSKWKAREHGMEMKKGEKKNYMMLITLNIHTFSRLLI